MSLNSLMVRSPETYLFTEDYRSFLETVLYFFRTSSNAPAIPLTAEIKHLYRFDMCGYLLNSGVDLADHHLVMRINELEDMHDLDISVDSLMLPDPDLLRTIKSIYKSKMKK